MPGGLDRKSGMSWMAAVCIGEKVTGWCGGRRREKTCRPRHKREESALNITELRSNDDDIQGRGAWIRRGKVPGIRGKAVHFPGGDREDGRMDGDNSISVCYRPVLGRF